VSLKAIKSSELEYIMSNPDTSLVNQKMAYARQVLEAVDVRQEGLVQRQARAALMDSCCMQLAGAYRTFLRELASHYRIAQADNTRSARQLQQALQAMSIMAPEVNEWLMLEAPDVTEPSWLELLLVSAAEANDPQVAGGEKGGLSQSSDLIAVVDVSRERKPELSVKLLQEWMGQLDTLITRQREAIQEC
jgi:Family of unknown function (DUF6586)